MYTSPRLCGILLIADQNNCMVLGGCLEIPHSAHIQHTTASGNLQLNETSRSDSQSARSVVLSAQNAAAARGRQTGRG